MAAASPRTAGRACTHRDILEAGPFPGGPGHSCPVTLSIPDRLHPRAYGADALRRPRRPPPTTLHPRAYGADHLQTAFQISGVASSPCIRGGLPEADQGVRLARFIPWHTGWIRHLSARSPTLRLHPREYGADALRRPRRPPPTTLHPLAGATERVGWVGPKQSASSLHRQGIGCGTGAASLTLHETTGTAHRRVSTFRQRIRGLMASSGPGTPSPAGWAQPFRPAPDSPVTGSSRGSVCRSGRCQ